jgi:hypothetical protein
MMLHWALQRLLYLHLFVPVHSSVCLPSLCCTTLLQTSQLLNILYLFMLGWPCISNYVCVTNQHDAQFFHLLHYHVATCFGPICSPSSGGRVYSVVNGTCITYKSTVGGSGPADSRLRSNNSTIRHIIHSASWWWATNRLETCRAW